MFLARLERPGAHTLGPRRRTPVSARAVRHRRLDNGRSPTGARRRQAVEGEHRPADPPMPAEGPVALLRGAEHRDRDAPVVVAARWAAIDAIGRDSPMARTSIRFRLTPLPTRKRRTSWARRSLISRFWLGEPTLSACPSSFTIRTGFSRSRCTTLSKASRALLSSCHWANSKRTTRDSGAPATVSGVLVWGTRLAVWGASRVAPSALVAALTASSLAWSACFAVSSTTTRIWWMS